MPTEIDEEPPPPIWRRALMEWVIPFLGLVVVYFAIGYMRSPALPELAPDFQLLSTQGEQISLTDYRGKTVVLNFWATWCGPCKLEGPSFALFAQNNPEIVVLGLASDRDPAKVRKTGRDLGLTYPLLMADPQTLQAYGIHTFPTTVIVGPEGRVRTAHTGVLLRPQLWALTKL